MRTRLIQIEQRVEELENKAREIAALAKRFVEHMDNSVQPELSIKGQAWYLAAHGVLEKLYPERLERLEHLYGSSSGMHKLLNTMRISTIQHNKLYSIFRTSFAQARGLLIGSVERLKSLELDVLIQISSALVSDEFETARQLFDAADGDESLLRAAGTVIRVALERHLLTIADARSVTITHPPSKKPMAQDVLNSLSKAGVLTAIQKSELETLFRIGNHCAHPKEAVRAPDVEKLIVRGKEMAATIV